MNTKKPVMNNEIEINRIVMRDDNPRKRFDEGKLAELASSIKEVGVLEPVLLRPVEDGFELVAGERRCRAAVMAGLKTIPALVRELSDIDVARIQLTENVARAAMSPIEEHYGVQRLIDLGEEIEAVSNCVGRSKDWVQLRLDLGLLPASFREALDSGKISLAVSEEVLKVPEWAIEKAAQDVLNLGDEANRQRSRDLLAMRYIEPAKLAKKWKAHIDKRAETEFGEFRHVGSYQERREYLESWGQPTGDYAFEEDLIGHHSADPADAELTWGEVAEVAGDVAQADSMTASAPFFIVVPNDRAEPVLMVEKRKLLDFERARRQAGEDYTLGPRPAAKESEKGEIDVLGAEDVIDPEAVINRVPEEARVLVHFVMQGVVNRWGETDLDEVYGLFSELDAKLEELEG